MTDEATTTANGAEVSSTKATAKKKLAGKMKAKAPSMGKSKKKAAKKAAVKKTLSKSKKTSKVRRTPKAGEGKRGREPRKALRALLLKEEHPDWKGAKIASEVTCTPNFVYKVLSKGERPRYEEAVKALSSEERKELLAGPIVDDENSSSSSKGKKTKSKIASGPSVGPGSETDLVSMIAAFQRAVRFLGILHARMLLGEFER